MCVIAVKNKDIGMPSRETMEICWDNNPDGAGYMYSVNGKVYIKKGFMRFEDFWKSLERTREKHGGKIPYVFHFRIGTQGGNTPQNTHPFPLSSRMGNLRKLDYSCNIGIAHNGIIDLTSSYGKVDYSDTMAFITEYLSLIIQSYEWHENDKTKKLIKRLCGSRLAILDKFDHIELIGDGWEKDDNGVWYSNQSYMAPKAKKTKASDSWKNYYCGGHPYIDDWYDDEWEAFYCNGKYDFDESYCPGVLDGDDAYCPMCSSKKKCHLLRAYMEA